MFEGDDHVFEGPPVAWRALALCTWINTCSLSVCIMCAGTAGAIISRIMENFQVTAMELAQFTRASAMEFYEVYRGIVPDFLVTIF